MKGLALVIALCALPAVAQPSGQDIATGVYGVSLGIPCITFAVLTAIPAFSGKPARNGFVINSIVFGAIATTFGGGLTYLNASTAKEGAGWIALSAGVLCLGALTAALGLFEMITMKHDGTWSPTETAPPPDNPQPAMPPPAGPVPVVPTLAPTPDGRGVTLALGGRF
ncbi:MAG: hypothetical protein QM723_02895 [Myxococcaceae bacterium]